MSAVAEKPWIARCWMCEVYWIELPYPPPLIGKFHCDGCGKSVTLIRDDWWQCR